MPYPQQPLAAVPDGIRLPCGTNKDLTKALLAIPLSRHFTIQYLLKSHYISLRKRMHRKIKKSFRFTKAASHSISRTPPRGCAGIRFGRCQLALTRIPRQFSRARIELSACLISHADSFLFRKTCLIFRIFQDRPCR